MRFDEKIWNEVNADIRDFLDHIRQTGSPTISQLILDEYQVSLLIDVFRVCVSTKIQLFDDGKMICSMEADYRNRSRSSYGVCVVVGRPVTNCAIGDSGLKYSFQDGSELFCVRDAEFENFSISGIPNTPAWF